MRLRVALVKNISVEGIASIIRVKRISGLGTTGVPLSFLLEDYFHPDDGYAFLQNVGSYKNHMK
jgi:hypothetical protein